MTDEEIREALEFCAQHPEFHLASKALRALQKAHRLLRYYQKYDHHAMCPGDDCRLCEEAA